MPVLDDWTYLEAIHKARQGGIVAWLYFLLQSVRNSWAGFFRMQWASFIPPFALSLFASFRGWPYFLLDWAVHIFAALLICRVVALLTADLETGFMAGAIYVVFPASNNVLFWSFTNCFYYFQTLALAGWFYYTWSKLAARGDFRYRFRDFALLIPVLFSGEQIFPALLVLLPLTHLLFDRREHRRRFLKFWLLHVAAVLVLFGFYALLVNQAPIRGGLSVRYDPRQSSQLRQICLGLWGALGFFPASVGWRVAWRPHLSLLLLLPLAGVAFFWGVGRCSSPEPQPLLCNRARRAALLLLWSAAGVLLTCLPVLNLRSFEFRYLYVPSMFLAPALAALVDLSLLRPVRTALAFAIVAYCLSVDYSEMHQCWIPQSRTAHAMVEALQAAGPIGPRAIVVFSGDPFNVGPARSFLNSASWAMNSALEHYTGRRGIEGGRDLVVNEQGDLALHR
ncbi:MAG TPA: hypothetical protein VET69_06670, partial [Terriglobales bacterium]|nr:hypothetical protein [Terriglobales bacterium]